MKLHLSLLILFSFILPVFGQKDMGVLPIDDRGAPLNLDFETGNLKDWTIEGTAFLKQPIQGDTVKKRRPDMASGHQGKYWIGGYEIAQDMPKGTLRSIAFKVTHPWATFLVGGGPHVNTCVEIIDAESSKLIFRASGTESENLERVLVDLTKHQNKKIYIQVVDKHSGHWGHVNFDDFRFHQTKPIVPIRKGALKPDEYAHAGLAPKDAPGVMTVPEGFRVQLFAGEPDVHQPIACCFDAKGRLWVVECYLYPKRHPHQGVVLPPEERKKGDRILIFEDTNQDGVHDKRTVFMEGLNFVTGIETGFGGVYIGAAPYFCFIPDKNQDDVPDAEPQILLDGWGLQDTHETLNSFLWGPDGWLYGCHGVFTHSNVGKPGAPDSERKRINAGIWRYHPTRHEFEVFCHGTSNPWGLDFNENGQFFIEACVIPHMWHMIQGARYHRQGGQHFNPYTFDDIKTIAKHRHYLGATPHSGNNKSDSVGGGHAHCGLMLYQGGSWPKKYHDQAFMGNIHGHRINVDALTATGSGYSADRSPDFLLTNDAYSRLIDMIYGPDGNMYWIDWYDKQACHHNNPAIWDRTNGRIFKVSYGTKNPYKEPADITKYDDLQLVQLLTHPNEWYVRMASRLLQERTSLEQKKFSPVVINELNKLLNKTNSTRTKLRALWALHRTGLLTQSDLQQIIKSPEAIVRAWVIQLSTELPTTLPEETVQIFTKLAKEDPSPVVRLYLTSALQRLSDKQIIPILQELVLHLEDKTDHNLPLLLWYALEPLTNQHLSSALQIASQSVHPQHLAFVVRKVASSGKPDEIDTILKIAQQFDSPIVHQSIVDALNTALVGNRNLKAPPAWKGFFAKLSTSEQANVRTGTIALAAKFGDQESMLQLRKILSDKKLGKEIRMTALQALRQAKDEPSVPVLQELLAEPAIRLEVIQALGSFAHVETPEKLLSVWPQLNLDEKRIALNVLSSRLTYAKELVAAVDAKMIPATELNAEIIQTLRQYNDNSIVQKLNQFWGTIQTTPEQIAKEIAHWKTELTKNPAGDLENGRSLFHKTCQQCHTLYGLGGKIGPDITGSNRSNLDYLLENIFSPSAVIQKEYIPTNFELLDGRNISGFIREETPKAYRVQTATELLVIAKEDVLSQKPSKVSMMPADQMKTFQPDEIRDLVAYLRHNQQVPMLLNEVNAKEFFNGNNLQGWQQSGTRWSVENQELVGRSPGLKKNEFFVSDFIATDFHLEMEVKLAPDAGNSGVQFRSNLIPGGDVKGYQADIGKGWWGKLYEEHGRALLWDKDHSSLVKVNDWNRYEIIADGNKIITKINGKVCVDLEDPAGSKRGIFALQLHSGGAFEIRFRNIQLKPLRVPVPPKPNAGN
ncbi:MAG: family 16 glycoside hydrolase [Zavarzinella sp.]